MEQGSYLIGAFGVLAGAWLLSVLYLLWREAGLSSRRVMPLALAAFIKLGQHAYHLPHGGPVDAGVLIFGGHSRTTMHQAVGGLRIV